MVHWLLRDKDTRSLNRLADQRISRKQGLCAWISCLVSPVPTKASLEQKLLGEFLVLKILRKKIPDLCIDWQIRISCTLALRLSKLLSHNSD